MTEPDVFSGGDGREFALDRFQREAIEHFDSGSSVLVAAPTGSGKTVIAEHAIERTLEAGRRTFYTSPIKALANQKYRDFCARYGPDQVGLLTGDLSIRGEAAIVVMTTEVLRNMLYEHAAAVRSLGCVVLDEVHYLQDRQRGPVWEEVLLNLPTNIRTVSLSATVSNLDEFVGWLRTVRGDTALVVEHERAVPLEHRLAVAQRHSEVTDVVPLLNRKRKLSNEARRYADEGASKSRNQQGGRDRGGRNSRSRGGRNSRSRSKWVPPRRSVLADELIVDRLGPLIWFIFSRAGCDEAVEQCRRAGLRYTTAEEGDLLADILFDATAEINDDDWHTLALDDWQQAFERGIASHHAGLIPAVKEAVEKAFAAGLLHVVFATETLALGVNLPARTVVLERLLKYNGEGHELLTPIEFTQLTGRAGRRGLDDEGTAVVCWSARVPVPDVAKLAASTDFPLRSAFAPNYNMVANLVRVADREAARDFASRSFAQYQRDEHARVLVDEADELRNELHQHELDIACEHGDVRQWLAGDHAALADDEELGGLRPGDVIAGPGDEPYMVISVAHRGDGVVLRIVNGQGRERRFARGQLRSPIRTLGEETPPRGVAAASAPGQKWAIEVLQHSYQFEATGVGACPELSRHERALQDLERAERRLAKLERRLERSSSRLVAEFDSVADILHERGFAHDWQLTDKGELLAEVHGETEAVLAEALHRGTFDGLEAPELAAVLSALVYEARSNDDPPPFRWPTKAVRQACMAIQKFGDELAVTELARLHRRLTRRPDPGLVDVVYRWALGEPLELVLDPETSGGDFVRSMRQVADLCRQIASIKGPLAELASDANYCVNRGVVRAVNDLPHNDPVDPNDPEDQDSLDAAVDEDAPGENDPDDHLDDDIDRERHAD